MVVAGTRCIYNVLLFVIGYSTSDPACIPIVVVFERLSLVYGSQKKGPTLKYDDEHIPGFYRFYRSIRSLYHSSLLRKAL